MSNPGDVQQKSFRGAIISIPPDAKLSAELHGITQLELYAALSIIIEKLRKDLVQ